MEAPAKLNLHLAPLATRAVPALELLLPVEL